MMNASQKTGGPRNVAGSGVRPASREFPSFQFLDTVESVSTAQAASRPFAPLRFTLDPSKWNNSQQQARPRLVRPTLISPPTRREVGINATAQNTHNAPLFPTMEEFKAQATKNLKRPASEVPPTSFLPYKKRAIAPTVSSEYLDESARRSPEYLEQLVANEPRMKEAASILLDMRSLSTTNETEENKSLPRNVSQGSVTSSVEDTSRESLTETPVNHVEAVAQPAPAAMAAPSVPPTRTVTPAPSGMRLAFPEDAHELNSLHCFVRAELLEVFALPDEANQSTARSSNRRTSGRSYSSGRVGLRCVHCAHLPRRARAGSTMSSFYPKSLSDLYRSVCTWQRIHFKTCRHIPEQVRSAYWQLKESDRTRGKTRYWVSSAQRLGLVDVGSERGGICFATAPNTTRSGQS